MERRIVSGKKLMFAVEEALLPGPSLLWVSRPRLAVSSAPCDGPRRCIIGFGDSCTRERGIGEDFSPATLLACERVRSGMWDVCGMWGKDVSSFSFFLLSLGRMPPFRTDSRSLPFDFSASENETFHSISFLPLPRGDFWTRTNLPCVHLTRYFPISREWWEMHACAVYVRRRSDTALFDGGRHLLGCLQLRGMVDGGRGAAA